MDGPKFYNEGYSSVDDLLNGLRDGSLLVHMRVADGKDFRYGIDPSAGSFLRSTEAWQWVEEEHGRGPELTFFADDLSWADNRNEVLRNSSGKSGALEAVFVNRTDDIVKYIDDNKVQLGASGSVVPYYKCSMYDYDDPVMKDVPAGVERGDWFTSHHQDVVAVVPADTLTEANTVRQVVKALLAAAAKLEGSIWYHTTSKENAENILKEGLKVNQKPTYSQASLSYMKDVYGVVPIFLAKSPEPYDGDNDGVVLAVDVSGLKLAADIPTLASHFGAYIDEDGVYFEEGEDRVPSEFAEEEHISFKDLVRGWAAPIAIELTGTAAVLKNIPISRLSRAAPRTAQVTLSTEENTQALKSYMSDFWEATQPHPFDKSSIYNGHTVVELRPFAGKIHVSWIQTLKPKSGAATETMKFLTGLADRHGLAMSLSAVPKGRGETKIPNPSL